MRRFAALAATTAVAMTGLAAVAAPAQAATEPVQLATGPSAFFDRIALIGAAADGVVYRRAHVGTSGYYTASDELVTDPGTGAATSVPSWGDGRLLPSTGDVAGPMLIQDLDDGARHYRNTLTDATGTVELADGQTYVGATPDGWLTTSADDEGTGHVFAVDAESGEATDLGTPPGWDGNGALGVVSDADGAVLTYTADGLGTAVYVPFAEPGSFTELAVSVEDGWLDCDGIAAGAVVCVEGGLDGAGAIHRLPLTGDDGTEIDPASGPVESVAMTATHVGWVGEDGRLVTVPVAGGPATPGPADVNQLASNGTDFLYTAGGDTFDSELRAIRSAGATVRVLAAAQRSPVVGGTVALGTGRVAWTDDSAAPMPVWSRTLSGGGTPASGAASLVSARSTGYGLSLSGRRTAFLAPDLAKPDSGKAVLSVVTGSTLTPVASESFDGGTADGALSGTRLLYRASGAWHLRDLGPAATNTSLPWLQSAVAARLWGNYVAWVQPDGSVWRRDLTAAAAVQLAPAAGVTGEHPGASVYLWGDYVAWRWDLSSCTDDACQTTTRTGYRNAATLAPAVALPADSVIYSLGAEGLVLYTGQYAIRNLATGVQTPLDDVGDGSDRLQADSGSLAWLTSDGVPTVAALPVHTPAAPRFLGGAISTVASGAWYGEMVTSGPLTSCAVLVKSGATVVRTLTCDAAAAAQGDALVTWDGKTSTGTAAAAGSYTWTLQASNGDGSLLAADGSANPVAGEIRLAGATPPAAVKPAIKKQPSSASVMAGATAVFTAAATGSPAPAVQWQITTNGGRTWANIAKATSGTLSFKAARGQQGYRYRAVFTNKAGSATTLAASLTIRTR